MSKKKDFEHLGTQRIDYFREKPKKKFDWEALFGGLFLVFLALILLGSCSG